MEQESKPLVSPVLLRRVVEYAALGYALFLVWAFYFDQRGLPGPDGYYHVRYANTFWHHPLQRQSETFEVSIWKERFSDKEFLFHLYLSLFCWGEGDLMTRGKIAGALLVSVFLLFLFFFLKRLGVPLAGVWLVILLSLSARYNVRLVMVRPHNFSMLLVVVYLYFLWRKSRWGILVTSFFYPWSYVGTHMLLLVGGCYVVGSALKGERGGGRLLLLTMAGLVAGSIIHPFFPHNLDTWYWQSVGVALVNWGLMPALEIPGATELYSMTLRSFLLFNPLLVVLVLGGLYFGMVSGKVRGEGAGMMAVALLGLVLFALSLRFLEYLVPLSILAAGVITRDVIGDGIKARRSLLIGLGVVTLGMLVFLHQRNNELTLAKLGNIPYGRLAQAGEWLETNLPAGTLVINAYWGSFPELYYYAPQLRFAWGMDPLLSYFEDSQKTELLARLQRGKPPELERLREEFGGGYLLVEKKWKNIEAGERDYSPTPYYFWLQTVGKERIVYEDEVCALVKL